MKKKILITGSTQGIGKAMAVAFVREGYDVIVHCSSNLEKAERIKTEIGAWKAVTADFSKLTKAYLQLAEKIGILLPADSEK